MLYWEWFEGPKLSVISVSLFSEQEKLGTIVIICTICNVGHVENM